jgi:P-type E1-E2 ATPase
MLEIDVPGFETLRLEYLVLDYNGTLACDGDLIDGVKEALKALAKKLEIHVVTADTFGKAVASLKHVSCKLVVLPPDDQDAQKHAYVSELGPEKTACIGNGRNDRQMLKEAVLGIAVIQREGAAAATLQAADAVTTDILSAFELLTNPLRLKATLRS